MHKEKPIRVNKSDYARVLITETTPYETPVIFSNDGFYKQTQVAPTSRNAVTQLLIDRLVKGIGKKETAYTIPYLYKIRKTSLDYRRLALLHPASQWRVKEFYEKYEKLIPYFCSNSSTSLRAPTRTAATFFHKNSLADVNQYKRGGIQEFETDTYYKHSSSFFAYQGFDRLYKFFNSAEFLSLEKRFNTLWTMDVTRCFDSIYTHSMAWATKEKRFVKDNISHGGKLTFGNDFDELMQKSNYNETNGVVIGPEISRIFAEVIFQKVDTCVLEILSSEHLEAGKDYVVRRYVDDIFIFAISQQTAQRIFGIYSQELMKFNLHVNSSKTTKLERPFFTKKSQIIGETNLLINNFFEKFLHSSDSKSEHEHTLTPGQIVREDRLSRSFIDSVKSVCVANSVSYDEISSYVIGAFFERIKRLINIDRVPQNLVSDYKSAISVIVEIIFFFYTAAPSVSSSYKLCASIILVARFSERHLGVFEHTVKQRLFELGEELFKVNFFQEGAKVENFVHLECVNVLLALAELGEDYLLPADIVGKIFLTDRTLSYFDIIACLYYIQLHPCYSQIRLTLTRQIELKLADMAKVDHCAESACLLLDTLCCPYIDRAKKAKLVRRFCSSFGGQNPPSASAIHEFVRDCVNEYWFVNWNDIDLLNALERKELKKAY